MEQVVELWLHYYMKMMLNYFLTKAAQFLKFKLGSSD